MSVKRIIDTSFWNDDKVVEFFTPEDKLFMLYLLTNPHTTQLGIYQINKKIMAFELGYSIETISTLLERFETKYKVIKYDESTKEIAIKNYLVYSIIKGGKPVEDLLCKEIKGVKSKELLIYVFNYLKSKNDLNETVLKIINNYYNDNEDNNVNDNDNEVSYNDSYNDSFQTQKSDVEIMFNEFWEEYPRHDAKKVAFKKFSNIKNLKVEFPKIIEMVRYFKTTPQWNKDNGQYIPMPSTFINQERWKDEINVRTDDVRYVDTDNLPETPEDEFPF